MGLWARKSGSLLGLDIGSSAVKLVELSHSSAGYRLAAHAVEALPRGAVVGGNISDTKAVGETLKRLTRRAGAKARMAAVAAAPAAVVVRTLAMDASLTDAELEVEVALETDRHVPYALDEAAVDFEPLHLAADDPALVEVLVAACRLEYVQNLEAAVALGGLRVGVVDVETHALQRAVERLRPGLEARDDPGAPLAIVDLGAATSTLVVLERGQVAFTREEPFDGGRWLREQPPGIAIEAAAPLGEDLLRLISRLLRLFLSTTHHDGVERLLLAGGLASTPGLAELAAERLGMAVEIVDPFAGMILAAGVDAAALARDAPALTTACGLALRSFGGSAAGPD